MARDTHKYRRLSVDFTIEEYDRLRAYCEGKLFMAAFVRQCTMDVLDDPLHAVKRIPAPPPPAQKRVARG